MHGRFRLLSSLWSVTGRPQYRGHTIHHVEVVWDEDPALKSTSFEIGLVVRLSGVLGCWDLTKIACVLSEPEQISNCVFADRGIR